MRTDNEIKTFVKQYNPVLSDSEVFMERLQDSLDGVEESRRIRKSAVKNYWTVSIIAFSIGAAIGMFFFLGVSSLSSFPLTKMTKQLTTQ